MITKVYLKFGDDLESDALAFETEAVNIFVGPNNSGKSLVLRELESKCRNPQNSFDSKIVDGIDLMNFTEEQADHEIEKISKQPNFNESIPLGHKKVGGPISDAVVELARLKRALSNSLGDPAVYAGWFLTFKILVLNGLQRLQLVVERESGDLLQSPRNILQTLYRDDAKRALVRRIVHDAFQEFFVLDPTNMSQLRIRLSKIAPVGNVEHMLDSESRTFQSNAQLINDASDGKKAFIGLICEVVAGDPSIIFIDEPEAFLYPPLASKLGRELSTISNSSHKRIFASTHSAMFLMGCIQSNIAVNIIRLTYRSGQPTARLLPAKNLVELMRNPLLRSTGLLQALFYEFVVVVESDADRAFYQEINERLLTYKPEWGIPDCLFINAQNKQTVGVLVEPLRRLGIPAVGIIDVDMILDGGSVFTKYLKSSGIPEGLHSPISQLKKNVFDLFEAAKQSAMSTDRNFIKKGGISHLLPRDKEVAENFFKQLRDYGLFVVPIGEVESWLSDLKVGSHGPDWLTKMFENMGSDPADSAFVKPGTDDIWEFMFEIKSWFGNEKRSGMKFE